MSLEDFPLTEADRLANELNFQQEQFAMEWLANGNNGTRAAIAAGYADPAQTASRLIRHPKVVAFIEAKRAERRAEIELAMRERHMSGAELVAMLSDMARFDLGELLDDQGRIDRTKLKAAAKHLKSVEVNGAMTKVQKEDRLAVIRLLMENLGLIKGSQTNVQVNIDFGERMAARRARALEGR